MRARSLIELAPRELRHLLIVDDHAPRVRLEQADDVLDGDGFPGARVADDDHRLALVHVEGESFEHALRAEGFVDVDQLDHRGKREAATQARPETEM